MKALLTSIFFLLFSSRASFAQVAGEIDDSPGFAPLSELSVVFANVVGSITTLVGFAALAMLVIGAFRFMLANGDPKAISQARGTIFWAIGGLVFVIASFIIIQIIAGFVLIPGIGRFCIPGGGVECNISSP